MDVKKRGGRPNRGGGQRNYRPDVSNRTGGSRKFENNALLEDAVVEGPDPKTAPRTSQGTRERLKVLMTKLAVSESKQQLVRETLQQIRGKPFKHKERNFYVDTGENLSRHYWMDDRSLQVSGVIKARTEEECSLEQLAKSFAIRRLEQYGFDTAYCEEALNDSGGDVGLALENLAIKVFGNPRDLLDHSGMELKNLHLLAEEQRLEEKMTLEAIYDESMFREKVTDSVWVVTVTPPYLKNYTLDAENNKEISLNLEIRFPEGSFYPFEPPLVFISVEETGTEVKLPRYLCLNMSKRLTEEARNNAVHHMPSVFSLISLINNEEEMELILQSPPSDYSLPPTKAANEDIYSDTFGLEAAKLNHHKNVDSIAVTLEQMIISNSSLKKKFLEKANSPAYKKMLEYRKSLPAWTYQEQIVSAVSNSSVVVVSGMTGCGKSTQVPQFILDDFLTSDTAQHRYIICTQPRRISATAVAQRVAQERDEKIGQSVGYQIRLETVISSATRLLFCTTGVLLRLLESNSTLKHVTHIVVDEVHERSEESDFLLLILRDLLPLRPDLRIILMSATLNAELFSSYFSGVPVVEIPGRTYPVEQLFLEDILEKVDYTLEEGSPYAKQKRKSAAEMLDKEVFRGFICKESLGQDEWQLMKDGFRKEGFTPAKDYVRDEDLSIPQVVERYSQCSDKVQRIIASMDHVKINYDLIECTIIWILQGQHKYPREGSILVFLPGLAEISSLYDQLLGNPITNPRSGFCILVPLHSSLSNEEQSKIFSKPKPGTRKIVIATNLAETSITIDDCVFVIDSGRMKENRYDPNKHMESLDTVWISVANGLQRRGRAGRVRSGFCFAIYTKHRFMHHFSKQPTPEIQLVSLERVILRCKILPVFGGKSTESVLGCLIEPPGRESVEGSMERLQHLGALDSHRNLTPLGCHLAYLPVDLRVGKLLLFGAMFRCVDAALTIAACLSYKSPFVSPWNRREEAQRKKMEWSTSNSDQLTVLRVFKAWQEACTRSRRSGEVFAEENFLSWKTLEMLCSLKQLFAELLSSIGFLPSGISRTALTKRSAFIDGVLQATGPKMNENGENVQLLLSVLCASMYPHLVRVLRPEHRYSQCSAGAVPAAPRPQQLRFLTRHDGTVFIHPSSVLYSCGNYDSPYVAFHEKVKTSRVFIRECSMVPAFPLLLFGGSEIHVGLNRGIFVVGVDDGWIKFTCDSHKLAELLVALRAELNSLLADKISDPTLDLYRDKRSDILLATVVKLISNPTAD